MDTPALRGTVLVVDDEALNRRLLAAMLTHHGLTVRLATNGQEALDQLAAEPFDLVLLDLVMPVVDGYAVLARLRELGQPGHPPVVVISATDEAVCLNRCDELGAAGHLPKPFSPSQLNALLARHLAARAG